MNIESEALLKIERRLKEALNPVPLRPEFVEALRQKLSAQAIPTSTKGFPWGYIAVIFASAISTALLLVVGIRATVTLLAAIGLIRRVKQTKVSGEVVPAQITG